MVTVPTKMGHMNGGIKFRWYILSPLFDAFSIMYDYLYMFVMNIIYWYGKF